MISHTDPERYGDRACYTASAQTLRTMTGRRVGRAPAQIMEDLRFDRHFRTPSSEGYHIMRGQQRLGSADLHFTSTTVHCTLVIEQELDRAQIAKLIERIDEDLVLSADTPRDDLVVSAYHGAEIGFFDDSFRADDEGVVVPLGDDDDNESDLNGG
jgi:hypothetical protein